ncbi:hypothetical protein TSOC_004397 [Tetrabaena socialis]|uniref:Globin domain-containing protein n=1 Tax=Tetrabaena socialis TaxID=47790 RepID=A0A2J8A946_9CHLO|nr:hypothetical protein TSOC_004397 [Tetrabaena socialis]|eukprot:PNH09048.1 hypothetical protein TSOC_004397 [Tetrabaena socialis]
MSAYPIPPRVYPTMRPNQVLSMLGTVVSLFHNFPVLVRSTNELVERHIAYGVELAHYDLFFTLLPKVLQAELGDRWDAATASAWKRVGVLVCTMAKGVYSKVAANAPPTLE